MTIYQGRTDAIDVEDGVEIETDRDFPGLGQGDWLHLVTRSGMAYRLSGPERADARPVLAMEPRIWEVMAPKLDRIGPRRFRLGVTTLGTG